MARTWECHCGRTVEAPGGYDTQCECGQWYNAFGQRLRSDWQDNPSNWNDDIGDMEGYEIQQANSDSF